MKNFILIFLFLFGSLAGLAQSISIDPSDPSVLMKFENAADGLNIPQMSTADRENINSPVAGLIILNSDDYCLDIYDGNYWIKNCGLRWNNIFSQVNGIGKKLDVELRGADWNSFNGILSSTNNGNVGVGTEYPLAKFDVAGKLKADAWQEKSMTQNGYARMGGILVQWGLADYTDNGLKLISFPKAFQQLPVINAVVGAGNNTGSGSNVPVKLVQVTNNQFKIAGTKVFLGDSQSKIRWIAIGI